MPDKRSDAVGMEDAAYDEEPTHEPPEQAAGEQPQEEQITPGDISNAVPAPPVAGGAQVPAAPGSATAGPDS